MPKLLQDGMILTSDQETQMSMNKVTVQPLRAFWMMHPDLNFDVALGGLNMLLSGQGQVRTEALEAPGDPSAEFCAAMYEVEKTEESSSTE